LGKINLLDRHVAELIAAGEVVERPASVVKELVENAIDAGCTLLTVEIQNGGTTLMRVTDNGSGLEPEDIPKAFLRHATSKVRLEDDLLSISTLGFRGEALASIAAVSRVELLTCTEGALGGHRYKIDGGEETDFREVGCPKGTSVIVRDLFYNVPARMKFLKKDITESNAISAIIDRIALSHPEISVRLIRDGKETLRTSGDGKLKSAIFAVYGKDFTSGLLETNYTLAGVTVSGYVSKPAAARPNRNRQVFFINGRYVKTLTAMAAIEQAYKGSLMAGKFPVCVLHIEMTPAVVDVNVHPSKTEVRFTNDKPIFDAVYHGVKSALMAGDVPREIALPKPPMPTVFPEQAQMRLNDLVEKTSERAAENPYRVLPGFPIQQNPERPRTPVPYQPPVRYAPPASIDIDVEPEEPAQPIYPPTAGFTQPKPEVFSAERKPETNEPERPSVPLGAEELPVRFLGEAFTTYALFEVGDRLVLMDKHAAHERILYEALKKTGRDTYAQLLLSPVSLTPQKEEFSALIENQALLSRAGYEIEEFGPGTLLIRAVPSILDQADAASLLLEIAQGLLSGTGTDTGALDWIYHNIACRAAIKAGTPSLEQELLELIRQIFRNPDLRYCPHGRPTTVVLTRKELEKQFGRVL